MYLKNIKFLTKFEIDLNNETCVLGTYFIKHNLYLKYSYLFEICCGKSKNNETVK